jgi:hypothetical protein
MQLKLDDEIYNIDRATALKHDHMVQSRLRQIVFRMTHDQLGSCFEGWVQHCVHVRRVHNALQKASMRLWHRSVSICFEQWVAMARKAREALLNELVQMQADQSGDMEKVLLQQRDHMETRLHEAFGELATRENLVEMQAEYWSDMEKVLLQKRDHMVQSRLRQIVFRMTHDQLGSCFEGWVQHCVHVRRVHNALQKASMRLWHRSVSICFEQWSAYIRDQRLNLVTDIVGMHGDRVNDIATSSEQALREHARLLSNHTAGIDTLNAIILALNEEVAYDKTVLTELSSATKELSTVTTEALSRSRSRTIQDNQSLLTAVDLETELIVGIDFTFSNTWNGKHSFGGRSLHAVNAGVPNPYMHVIATIARTLEPYDQDGLIPCFGFGDEVRSIILF